VFAQLCARIERTAVSSPRSGPVRGHHHRDPVRGLDPLDGGRGQPVERHALAVATTGPGAGSIAWNARSHGSTGRRRRTG
jgi:hypothetical protein